MSHPSLRHPDAADEIPAPARRGESAWSVDVATSIGDMERIEAEWRDLEREHGRDIHAFQTVDWCLGWARTFLSEDAVTTPFVVCVRRRGRLVLLWPLMRCRLGPLRALSWLSGAFAQYGDVLSALRGPELSEAMGKAWAFVVERAEVDIVRLRHVREDANIHPFLEKHFRRAAWEDGAPWMDLSAFSSVEDYERRYSREQRRRRKRIRKSLEKRFGAPLEFGILTPADDIAGHVKRLLCEKRAWLDSKGLISRPLAVPDVDAFLSRLPMDDGGGLRMVITCLRAGDAEISWELGFRFKGRHYGYVTAHERTLTHASPTRLHMDLAQKRALEDGMRVYDLLVPVADHKRTWSSSIEPVRDYYLPLTAAGRLLGENYLRHVRPWLRKVVQHVPKALRLQIRHLHGLGTRGR